MFNNREEFYNWLEGKKVCFIGAGVSHRQLIEIFVKKGAIVTLCDKKNLDDFKEYKDELLKLNINLSLGEDNLKGIKNQDMIMRTPGFYFYNDLLQQEIKNGTLVTSETELFLLLCPCKTFAVTGSDGKTTTTSLIAQMLRKSGKTTHLGGNIGKALLPMIEEINKDDVAVLELSSFQLISMKNKVDVCVVTNVTPNHLDVHKTMQEYILAKKNLFLYQEKDSLTVLGYENETTKNFMDEVVGEGVYFSRKTELLKGGYINKSGFLMLDDKEVINKDDVALRGEHNLENLLAAFCAVKDDVSIDVMKEVAKTFKGVEHRIEPVRELNGVRWYNDSIGTSPTRTIAGLNSFNQKISLIAGGYDKKISFEPLVPHIINRVKLLVLMGQTGPMIYEALKNNKDFDESKIKILKADSMEQAVKLMYENTQDGDIAMLSSASASFDMYENFEKRGEHFKSLVNQLK